MQQIPEQFHTGQSDMSKAKISQSHESKPHQSDHHWPDPSFHSLTYRLSLIVPSFSLLLPSTEVSESRIKTHRLHRNCWSTRVLCMFSLSLLAFLHHQGPWPKHWPRTGADLWVPYGGCPLLLRDGLNAENQVHYVVLVTIWLPKTPGNRDTPQAEQVQV